MYDQIQIKKLKPSGRNLFNWSPSRRGCIPAALALALAWIALPPKAQAICQQGCDLILENTFLGNNALSSNTTGYDDTAVGSDALSNNTNGIFNTAIGRLALSNNTDGFYNTAIGMSALFSNTTASYNTATGTFALISNTVGASNTVTGSFALQSNTTGSDNSVTGSFALRSNTTGSDNTADGREALRNNKTSNGNIAVGFSAGSALTTGDNNIDIGNAGVADEANIVRIGKLGTQTATFIAGISGAVVPDGVGVIVGTDGKLGTVVSSERYKDAIKPMDKASEAILSLQPVTFRYKHELDPKNIPQFGLVAEQEAKVDPDLVARDEQGEPYTLRYEAVNAMLLNEFLKEHRKVEEQQTALDQLKSKVAQQEDLRSIVAQQQIEIAALTSQIQKVSERLAVDRPAPRIVSNKE